MVAGSGEAFKLVNSHSAKVLGMAGMSTNDGGTALQWSDDATNDQFWKFLATQ